MKPRYPAEVMKLPADAFDMIKKTPDGYIAFLDGFTFYAKSYAMEDNANPIVFYSRERAAFQVAAEELESLGAPVHFYGKFNGLIAGRPLPKSIWTLLLLSVTHLTLYLR